MSLLHPELTLTPLQHQIIALLVQGATVSDAAATLGVHRTTIHYWKRHCQDFGDALHDAQEEHAEHIRSHSERYVSLALDTLRDLLEDQATPPTVRLKAALHILTQATHTPAPQPKPAAERRRTEQSSASVQPAVAASREQAPKPATPAFLTACAAQAEHNNQHYSSLFITSPAFAPATKTNISPAVAAIRAGA